MAPPRAARRCVSRGGGRLRGADGPGDRDLRAGTVDSWIAWTLSQGEIHVSDHTNSSATTSGLRVVDSSGWRDDILEAFGLNRQEIGSSGA